MILAANGRAAGGSLTKQSQSLQLRGKEKCHELGRGPPNEAPVWDNYHFFPGLSERNIDDKSSIKNF